MVTKKATKKGKEAVKDKKPVIPEEKQPKKKAALAEKKKPLPAEEVLLTEAETEEILGEKTEGAENGGRYWEAVGRRKTATARVRLFTRGEKGIWVNEKPYQMYFQYPGLQTIVEEALRKMKSFERFRVSAKISGGGPHSQAEALRHAIARALVEFNPDFRKRLKRAGYLTRDPRMRERKKFGLKGARRAPQWAKR